MTDAELPQVHITLKTGRVIKGALLANQGHYSWTVLSDGVELVIPADKVAVVDLDPDHLE